MDLSEHVHREPEENFYHSRHWHSVMEKIQFGGLALGLSHYFVGEGEATTLAQTLAGKISRNAPFANMLMLQAIPRINDMGRDDGLFAEALAASMSQTTPDAQEGLRAFLEKRAPKFR